MGNLEFNASDENLREVLSYTFKWIQVKKITIPRVDVLSKYGFIHHGHIKLL